jgi:single-strand DNA-binding protein
MPNLNKCQLMGNITREIELRYTPAGTAVADLGLAINRSRKDDNGEKIEETTFVDVTLWGRVAEVAHQYAGKGKPIFVEGRLQLDTWEDKNSGEKRSKLKIVGENIQLLGSKDSSQGSSQPSQGGQQQAQPQQGKTPTEDLPF